MGQPQLRSTKDAPASLASLAAATPSEIWLVAICTPKQRSFEALTSRARSTRSPLVRLIACCVLCVCEL